jgi:hypothetical protein
MDRRDDRERRSPVVFNVPPLETSLQHGWEVVLTYANEDQGPFLVDLSHRRKWDIQHASLEAVRPWDTMFPPAPGQCRVEAGRLLSRRNFTQAAIWHLTDDGPESDPEPYFTEVTDGLCLLALVGSESLSVMERVSSLDLTSPNIDPPFLLQGPVLHVPCHVVVLAKNGELPVVLTAFSRGYGQAMAEALLEVGRRVGLRPGGETVFRKAFEALHSSQGAEGSSHAVDPP